jgi:DNA-binding MarR family transcriptional regulator
LADQQVPIHGTALEWPELGDLLEGLAYASRPIFEGAREVTERYGLGPRGAFMLNLIEEGICFPDKLADKLKTLPSLITSDLVRLKDAGLVTASPSQHDRRRSQLALTEAGEQVCNTVRGNIARIVSDNLAPYSPEQQRLFSEMLQAVRHLPGS